MQKEESFYDKKRLAAEHITLCLRAADLVDNTFQKGTFQWEVPYFAVAGGKRLTGKLWFVSTTHDEKQLPTSWDVLFGNTTDWPGHNIQIEFNAHNADGTPNIQKGYHFNFLNVADSECPCRFFKVLREPTQAELEATVHVALPPARDADTYSPEGVNYADPISPATQAKLLKAASSMMQRDGTRIDPGNFESMTEGDGQRRLDTLRAQWLAGSAGQVKSAL